jgi:hypothetical protein
MKVIFECEFERGEIIESRREVGKVFYVDSNAQLTSAILVD